MPEESAQAEAPAPAPAPAEAKGGKGKMLVMVAGGVLVLALGGGAAWFLGLLPHERKAEAKEEAKEAEPAVGALHALEPFIANLADEDGKRYLKTTLEVEFFQARVPEEFNARLPQIRDLLLTLFTSKMFSEIRTPAGKAVLRDEIVNRLNRAMGKDLVKAVYFTDFIVQ